MYTRPGSIEEAVAALAGSDALVICGGTDVYPAHAGRRVTKPVVDLSAVASLRGIAMDRNLIRIGGATTWTDIVAADLPAAFDGLKAAAREVGSIQIQNRGTIAGNLCNASPAADGVPPLLTLDAAVELHSAQGIRQLPLSSFITSYRKTAIAPGEILAAVTVPVQSPRARGAFVKLGARRYLVISILMAAALIERDGDGRIVEAAIAVGSASPVAQRLRALERDLVGLKPGIAPSSIIQAHHLDVLSPIDDVRATANYRLDAARTIAGEALDRAAGVWSVD